MRALTIRPLCRIAVVAECLKSWRIAVPFQPPVEKRSATDLFTVFAAATVDMIDAQKSPIVLTTALAFSAVHIERFPFSCVMVLSDAFRFAFSIFCVTPPPQCLLNRTLIGGFVSRVNTLSVTFAIASVGGSIFSHLLRVRFQSLVLAFRRADLTVFIPSKVLTAYHAGHIIHASL